MRWSPPLLTGWRLLDNCPGSVRHGSWQFLAAASPAVILFRPRLILASEPATPLAASLEGNLAFMSPSTVMNFEVISLINGHDLLALVPKVCEQILCGCDNVTRGTELNSVCKGC